MERPNACCCRAMCIPNFRNLQDLLNMVKEEDLNLLGRVASAKPLDGPAMDRVKTVQALIELPQRWEDWPEDAKQAIPYDRWEVGGGRSLHATCKYLDRDTGACMIYDRRPEMCRVYAIESTTANRDGRCQFKHCAWNQDGRCCPTHKESK